MEQDFNLSEIENLFTFTSVTKTICLCCKHYTLNEASSKMLNMPVPHPHSFEGYETKTVDELEYKVALGDCVKLYHQSDMVEKNCSNCKSLGPHSKVKTIKKFPKYLTVVFDIKSVIGWVPRKLHALFQFDPDHIDLSDLVFKVNDDETNINTQMMEEEIKVDNEPQVDQQALVVLSSMGFSHNRCVRALMENGNNTELALNSIFATMDDPSMDEPYQPN